MPNKSQKEIELIISEYLSGIPSQLHGLLVPFNIREKSEFTDAVKKLRIREKERNYVLEIQFDNELPLRPNETLKETMIKVRLKKLKEQKKIFKKLKPGKRGNLPVDPLE